MTPTRHDRLTQVFLLVNSLFWLPWGLVCLLHPEAWSGQVIDGMDVFDLSSTVARTEVRAMYGGLQMAIGILAVLGAFRPRHRHTALVFFVLALTGLAACRFAGMVIEGEHTYLALAVDGITPGRYNQAGLTMYELPNAIFAWALLLTGRPTAAGGELERLRAENAALRDALGLADRSA